MKKPYFANKKDFALPSPMEEACGKTFDPSGHEMEIEAAKQVLHDFIVATRENREPTLTLGDVAVAADTLCTYSGCPLEAFRFVQYLTSPQRTDYRNVADNLIHFLPEMSELITWRVKCSTPALSVDCPVPFVVPINGDDMPF